MAIRAVEENGLTELTGSGSEVVRLLNRLDLDPGVRGSYRLLWVLLGAIRSTTGRDLAPHWWRFVGEMVWALGYYSEAGFEIRDMGVMRSLKQVEDWEKLEVWMVIVWRSLSAWPELAPELVEDIGGVTLKVLLSRPSALWRFEKLSKHVCPDSARARLVGVLDRARVETLALKAQHPPYVSVHPSLFLSVLTPSFFPSSQSGLAKSLIPLPPAGDDNL